MYNPLMILLSIHSNSKVRMLTRTSRDEEEQPNQPAAIKKPTYASISTLGYFLTLFNCVADQEIDEDETESLSPPTPG